MNPLSIPLPVAVRRQGEIIGIVAGIVCFPVALYVGAMEGLFPNGPAALVLPIVILTALAGAIASLTADESKAPDICGVPLRVGARAGFIASLVAGAFTVLASTFHSFGIGCPASVESNFGIFRLLLPSSPASRVIVLALLALPPSLFFGLTGALLAGMLKTHPSTSDGTASIEVPLQQERSVVFLVALLLTLAGYFSPLLLVFKPKPAPVVVAAPQPVQPKAERPVTSLALTAPAPPKWRYEKPVAFDTAEAGRIVVKEERNLGEVETQMPVAISPDGLRFAYFRNDGGRRIQVTELETLDVIASTQMAATPKTMAWSPDSKMLLITTEDRGILVFDATNSRLLSLPLPRGARVPEGLPNWWEDKEVLFAHSGSSPSLLNLDTLRTSSPDESLIWRGMTTTERNEAHSARGTILPHNKRWEMRVEAAVRRYDVPLNPSAEWTVQESLQFAFVHSQKACRFILPPIDVNFGDYLIAANDGSKLIRIRDSKAVVYYFTLRSEPAMRFKITMPSSPDSSLTSALEKKNVAAFICSPAVNPLNGKTVAPDRDHVKAIARLESWQDKEAEFWMDENYLPLQPGDVVADLHVWNDRTAHAVSELGRNEWFAVIEKFENKSAPPAQSDAAELDRDLSIAMDSKNGADHVERGTAKRPSKQQQTVFSPPANQGSPMSNVEKMLGAFIEQHHAKSSRGDVEGLVADYNDHVDHFNNGLVDRSFIRKDELEYHSPGTRVTETIVTRPTFSEIEPNFYSASYSISYHRIRPDGRWTKGISDIELQIMMFPNGPRISRQRAQNRDQQRGP